MPTRRNAKTLAQQTLIIQHQGYYYLGNTMIDITEIQRASEKNSVLLSPDFVTFLSHSPTHPNGKHRPQYQVLNQSTVETIHTLVKESPSVGVLNFASAKNPGGGFFNGSLAQEESLALCSGLYNTQKQHNDYYMSNRTCGTFMYTDHAIYSPNVVFFRDHQFFLVRHPVYASVLTIPAVNMGMAQQKGEDVNVAKETMKNRMRAVLGIFMYMKERTIILGAYGCGIFKNDAEDIARWWKELLFDDGWDQFFDTVAFAVLDPNGKTIAPFKKYFDS